MRLALRAHGDHRRETDGAPFILHPLEVASLLSSCGCSDEVSAAAILHDTLEATGATSDEIELRFGARVGHLVSCTPEGRRKLTHYRRSLAMLEGALGDHPLVTQLRFGLEAIRDLPPAATRRAGVSQAMRSERDVQARS